MKCMLAMLTFTVSLLSACGNEPLVSQPSSMPKATSETAPATSDNSNDATKQSKASSSDEINWDKVNDPLIDDPMSNKLKKAIDAIVSKDIEQFHQSIDTGMGTAHDYLLDNTMTFTHIDTALKEGKRVLVPVHGQLTVAGDTAEKEAVYTFYFEKDPQDQWKIIMID